MVICILLLVFLVHFALVNAAQPSIDHHHHGGRFSLPLIHRDSIHSPYYNPKDSIADRARHAIQISQARVAYLMNKKNEDINRGGGDGSGGSGHNSLRPNAGDVIVPMVSELSFFYVNISIGQPPVPVLLVMDTGSSLTWVKCQYCRFFSCGDTIFNYYSSSSFKKETCKSPYCQKCKRNSCEFYVHYNDGSESQGFLAEETFTSQSFDHGTVASPNMVFGCAGTFKEHLPRSSGVLGLSVTDYSFPHQLGSSFSYCVGNVSDPTYSYSYLILGGGAVMLGDSTSITVDPNHGQYLITLKGVRIGDTSLPVVIYSFISTIIDSGTALTYVDDSIFKPLMEEVKKLLGPVEYYVSKQDPNLVCFKGNKDSVRGFPVVTLEFDGGAELALDAESFFLKIDEDGICSTVSLSKNGKNIIGIIAQQFYNVGYNLGEKKLYLERIDCQLVY